MKKRNILLPILVLVLCFSCQGLFAQSDKEEVNFWKKKAKAYTKNPLSLKAEFEQYQSQIRELKKKNLELVESASQLQTTTTTNADAKSMVDSLKWALIQKEGELQSLSKDYEKLERAYKAQRQVNEIGVKPGLVYRVQIGAFVFYEMNNPPSDAEDFVHEKSDGYNKYVVGSFREFADCEVFKDELREMGIKDAWIVPYIDGSRSTMAEADSYLDNQGSSSFPGN